MGSPIDLTLGCSPQAPSNGYPSDVIPKVGSAYPGGYLESIRKAKEHLRSMEDERRKVDGFKRELPICIQLLEDAIQVSKEKLANGNDMPTLQLSCSSMDSVKERNDAMESRPTLEEFLPLKRRWDAAQQSEGSDGDKEGSLESPRGTKRPAWMTEPQLWIQNSTSTQVCHEKEKEPERFEQDHSCVTDSQLRLGSKEKSTGAFLPFLREHPDGAAAPLVSRPTPTMAHCGIGSSLSFGDLIASPNSSKAASEPEAGSIDAGLPTSDAQTGKDMGMLSNGSSGGGSSTKSNPSKRKARRCWSPELHRRFVSALHQLGGADIATPKQICELMKVDGLTNDEVKSHLQKYRLHTRRPSSSPQSATGAQSPQLVVLGGIWVPPKYTSSASQLSAGVYDSSTGHHSQPTQFYQSAVLPQDHYFACISNGPSGPSVEMHRQPIFEPQQAASQSQSSPQGSLQVTSQFSEATQGPNSTEVYHDDSGEEAKSDSTSWKNESYEDEELKKSSSDCTSN
ncbi:hypothetical protein KC19_10G070700 [Ceratodon purpureus]|uniref:HTH myb-type domain-containing protein n=1 Tax=Ceratodon purpureus TaxID=3225 RepID=A0A8T0GIZ9_CERPU|nr:hypothetical protein KC19_10G070700 [Ceratodon purpureus]KAG0558992.1 hypothetical protein KC19_10G070700 [Ceratodon purpureus]KAG0558993.1 hypothetical protein KC19_10G070700 [Ceratodon purpureus]